MEKKYLLLIILTVLPLSLQAQIDSTAVDSLPAPRKPIIQSPDSLLKLVPAASFQLIQPDTSAADSARLFQIRRWIYHPPLNAHIAATDSTLRWNIWPSWVYKKNRAPGVISFRMGSIGRTNTFSIFAHQPKYLELYWGDIRMNDPVTGTVNWNGMPLHKIARIYEEDTGLTYRTTYYLKEYHLIKPLTKLIYSESKFEYRNLEFMVSRNFGRKTNVEVSYWYRSGGGGYKNSSINGHQIYARVSHHLTHTQKLKFALLSNSFTNSQPFGYQINNMKLFNFNRFTATPEEPSAVSKRSSTIISLDYYRRPADTTRLVDNFHSGIFMRTVERRVKYSADTTYYSVRGFGANIQKWATLGPITVSGAGSYVYYTNTSEGGSSLNFSNWSIIEARGEVVFQPLSFLSLSGNIEYRRRSDGYSQYLVGANISLTLFEDITLSAAYTIGSRMPTPQQLYWQSVEFKGNAALQNEHIKEMHIKLKADVFKNTVVGIRAQLKQIDNGIMLVGNTFTNIAPYGSFSATAWFDYKGKRFEFYGSATFKKYDNFLRSPGRNFPLSKQARIWFKAGAYVKGYLFDRATYVKAGFSGIFSPQPYRAAHYFVPLDFWQPKSNDPLIPSFHRLDFDLSARVRTIMVTLRVENVLDNFFQRGYFETAGYPMNRRRFIFGIKVLFRN